MPDAVLNDVAVAAKSAPDQRESVILECMGLIAHEARRCRNMLGEDAFGEASVALLQAIDSYEPEQGDFRTWAVFNMRCYLAVAARTEKRFRARIMRGENVLATDGPEPMPELLTKAVAAGTLTERQAQIVHAKAAGADRTTIMDRFAISDRTYRREVAAALVTLRAYL